MSDEQYRPVLAGQKALVVGVANDQSIAYGCAKAFRTVGADLAVTWLNEKAQAATSSRWRGNSRRRSPAPLDVSVPGQLEAMFEQIRAKWGRLDILVHSIAFAPKERSAGRAAELFRRRVRQGDGYFLPFLHPDGEAGGAADDRWRDDVRDELLRRQPGGAELQRDGSGEGGAGGGVPLSGL